MSKNKYYVPLYEPYILTTPLESLPYLVLQTGSSAFNHYIMNHDIVFYAFDYGGEFSDGFWLRYIDHKCYENLQEIDRSFLSMELWKNIPEKSNIMQEFLKNGYALLCDYNCKYIKSLRCKNDQRHGVIINSFDLDKREYAGKEYKNNNLVDILLPEDELMKAISMYIWDERTRVGLFAYKEKGNQLVNHEISCNQLNDSLEELINGRIVKSTERTEVYGLLALKVFREGIQAYWSLDEQIYRCYYLVNYITTSLKLMYYRAKYLESVVSLRSKELLTKCMDYSYGILITILKKIRRNSYSKEDIHGIVLKVGRIEVMYEEFIEALRKDIGVVVKKEDAVVDIYRSTRIYRRIPWK